jgi:hypothetical protein
VTFSCVSAICEAQFLYNLNAVEVCPNTTLRGPILLGLLYFRHKSGRRKSNGEETASVSTSEGIRSHWRWKTPSASRIHGMVAHGWRTGASGFSPGSQDEKTSQLGKSCHMAATSVSRSCRHGRHSTIRHSGSLRLRAEVSARDRATNSCPWSRAQQARQVRPS